MPLIQADPSTWKMAGGDLLYIMGGPVNVVRGFVPGQSNGTVWAEYWNLFPTNMWDTSYTVPVGVDTYENTTSSGPIVLILINLNEFDRSNSE